MEQKTCPKCGATKPAGEFFKNRACKDGLSTYCKTCQSAAIKRWKQEKADHYKAQQGEYRKANAERISERQRRWNAENREWWRSYWRAAYAANPEADRQAKKARRLASPEKHNEARRQRRAASRERGQELYQRDIQKHKARAAAYMAVVSGELPRPETLDCAVCGPECAGKAKQYHHPDYSQPLKVIPVCVPCHNYLHRVYK